MTEESSTVRAPALFEHCVRVYTAMEQEAKARSEAGVTMIVWEGFPTKMIKDQLKLSTPYYTYTLRALSAMGCIRQLRRGGSSTKSQWELVREPTVEAYLDVNAKEPTAAELRIEAVEQVQRDIVRRLERLEQVTHVSSVPIDFISDPTPPGGIRITETEPKEIA